jgi:hypothetical protein
MAFELGPKQNAWLEALKSGNYKHGTGSLCSTRSGELRHCCLGVLCETLKFTRVSDKGGFEHNKILQVSGLPASIAEDMGLRKSLGFVDYSKLTNSIKKRFSGESWLDSINRQSLFCLTSLNDSCISDSWKLIIEIMETCPEAIFSKSV